MISHYIEYLIDNIPAYLLTKNSESAAYTALSEGIMTYMQGHTALEIRRTLDILIV